MKMRLLIIFLSLLMRMRSFSLMRGRFKPKCSFSTFSLACDSKYALNSNINADTNISGNNFTFKHVYKFVTSLMLSISLLSNPSYSFADDELAQYAAQGNDVGVDGQCFFKKCSFETSACANDASCLKGLACLARYATLLVAFTEIAANKCCHRSDVPVLLQTFNCHILLSYLIFCYVHVIINQ